MPITTKLEEEVEIPDGVKIDRSGDEIMVSGPNGEVTRRFGRSDIDIEVDDDVIVLSAEFPTKREKSLLGTYTSHLKNMVKGSQEYFTYKLKIIYSHFPVKVRTEGDEIVIENFIGEDKPRRAKILGDTKVEIERDIVTLKGPDLEDVGQTAANIERATKIKKVDPRVFQDGIYIIEKAGKPLR